MPSLSHNALFMASLSQRWNLYAESNFTAGNPALYTQNRRPGVYGRSLDTTVGTPAFVRLDPTVNASVDPDAVAVYIGFVRHNGTAGTLKYRVRISTSPTFSSTQYDSGAGGIAVDEPFADRGFAHVFDNPGSPGVPAGRYVEVSLWATAAGYIDVGVIFVGEPYQPGRNMARGSFTEPSTNERVTIVTGSQGQEFPKSGILYDEASGVFQFDDYDDMKAGWGDFTERVGRSGQVMFLKDPTEVTYRQQMFVYGRMVELGQQREESDGLYQILFGIEGYH